LIFSLSIQTIAVLHCATLLLCTTHSIIVTHIGGIQRPEEKKMNNYSIKEYKLWIMQENDDAEYEVQDETGNSFGFFSTYKEAVAFCQVECVEQEFFGCTVTWGTAV
jgi:hypothetical protein